MHPPWSIEISTTTLPGRIDATMSSVTTFGALAPGEHGADHEVGVGRAFEREGAARERLHPSALELIDVSEPIDVQIEDGDVRLHPRGDPRGVAAGHPGAEHDHACGGDARGAAHRDPRDRRPDAPGAWRPRAAPCGRDLAHRREEREAPVGQLGRLVRDGGDVALGEELRQRAVGREMQEREQELPGPEPGVFLRLRLLYLQDHVRPGEDLVGAGGDARSGAHVFLIADRGASPAPGLQHDLVTRRGELSHPSGSRPRGTRCP